MRTFGRVAAIALLLCIPVSLFSVYALTHQGNIGVRREARGYVVAAVRDPHARALGVRPGDSIDAAGLSVGDRVRMFGAPVFRPFSLTVDHAGRRIVVPMSTVAVDVSLHDAVFEAIAQASAIAAFLLGALVLWRRPGPISLTFALYTLNFLDGLPTALLLGFLPDPFFSAAVVAVPVVVGTVPQLALVAFALRFPGPLAGRNGVVITRVFDAMLIGLGVLSAFRAAAAPLLSDPWLDTAPSVALTVALVAIVLVRYASTRGENRRRLAWVAVGSIASAIGTVVADLQIVGAIATVPWSDSVSEVVQDALPIAFAYAILRHRVLDLGFAINRTLVYSAMTAALVVAVGAIDWLGGRLLGSTHLSAALEAAVTIALGAALGWIHGRVARGIDRLLFRRRYRAAKRIESRIAALDFATVASAVDAALVDEVVSILQLGSAAVFRRMDAATFVRTAATGWEFAAAELPANHLLLRTLQAENRAVVLADAGIEDPAFPNGTALPDTAIPIVMRHESLGFALYGHRAEGGSLDPEERDMLARLVAAAARAYDAIDAAEWRRRALSIAVPARAVEAPGDRVG